MKSAVFAVLGVLFLMSSTAVAATSEPLIVVFYEEGCHSCEEMEELLAGMTVDAPAEAIVRYEVTAPGSMDLLVSLSNAYDIDVPEIVPIVFVAEDAIVGMGRAQEFTLRNAIGDCLSIGCESPIARLPISQLRTDLPRLALFLALFLALAWFQLH